MPRLLLLVPSASYRAGDFLAAARSLGVEVTVGSDHRQVLARRDSGRSLRVDLSDPARGTAQVLEHARRFPLHAVLGTDDESVHVAAAAARALGLPGNAPQAVCAARDKARFREALARSGVTGPDFAVIGLRPPPERSPLPFPCVLKPRSLSASRGVMRVDDAAGFEAACARLARILGNAGGSMSDEHRSTALLERYLPGQEVALEGVLEHGALLVLALLDKPDPLDGPCFEETLLVQPSRQPAAVQARIARSVEDAARALGLRHGPVHAELRVHDGVPVPIEIAPRTVGGLCARALRFAGRASLEALVIRNALGMPVRVEREPDACGVMMIPVPRAGRLVRVCGVDAARSVPGVEDVVIGVSPGEVLVPLPEGSRYPGFIFARAATPEAVEDALRAAHAALRFEVEE